MTAADLLLLAVACVALLGVLLSLWQMLVIRRLRRDVAALQQQQRETPTVREKPAAVDFSASLDAVERQQLQSSQPSPPAQTVDKYRYVGALAEQGLDAQGIAAALQMPLAEVEQLLQLAKLKQSAVSR